MLLSILLFMPIYKLYFSNANNFNVVNIFRIIHILTRKGLYRIIFMFYLSHFYYFTIMTH